MLSDHTRPSIPRPPVLCVDDDPDVLVAVRRALRNDFDVTAMLGGLEGLNAVWKAETPFHVILSDLRMPAMSGLGLLQCVRDAAPDTVRILLTAYSETAAAVAAVNAAKVYLFLSKPFDPAELVAAVRAGCQHYQEVIAARQHPPHHESKR